MTAIKRLSALFIICAVIITNIFTISAETIEITEERTITTQSDYGYHVATNDKYIFSSEGASSNGTENSKTFQVSVYDKATGEYLTKITYVYTDSSNVAHQLRPSAIHVKGDYLYVTYTYAGAGGNPVALKYDISHIYKDMTISPTKTTGLNKNYTATINNDVVCSVNLTREYIAFHSTDNLTNRAGITLSDENLDIVDYMEGVIYLENDVIYYKRGAKLYFFDASEPLSGNSQQDLDVANGVITLTENIKTVDGYKTVDGKNYIYVSTASGVHIYDMTSLENPVSKGTIPNATSVTAMEINNGYLYVASGYNFNIYSLENPESPELLTSYELSIISINDIHLREGKVYITGMLGVVSLNIEGIEIDDTTVPGSDAKAATIEQGDDLTQTASDICADENYICLLNTEKNIVTVLDAASHEEKATVFKEENSAKLNINSIELINGELYVSYEGYLRKYNLSRLAAGKSLVEQAAAFMYTESICDYANFVATGDNYIFVAGADEDCSALSNSKIYVFEKTTGKFLTSLQVDSYNNNYDAPVRNMYALGDKLYVTYNNVKTGSGVSGTIRIKRPYTTKTFEYSPIYEFDFSNIAEGGTPTLSKVVCSNSDLANISHPYNRGGNSFFDAENNLLYQGKYTTSTGQNYVAWDISTYKSSFKLTNGSYDCTKFIVSGNLLCEILRNNGGLKKDGVTSQEYNKVNFYDISRPNAETTIDLSADGKLKGTYQTSLYGTATIKDVAVNGNIAYVGTSSGVEVVDLTTYKKVSSLLGSENVYRTIIEDNKLFVSAYGGVYIISLVDNTVLAKYESSTPIYDIEVDTENKLIYTTWKKLEGFGAVLSYDDDSIDFERYLTLENTKSSNAKVGESYIFSLNEDNSTVSVYNTQSKGKKSSITGANETILSKMIMQGSKFYTYEEKTLTSYSVPSATSALTALQTGTLTADGTILGACADSNYIYLATEKGVVVVNSNDLSVEITLCNTETFTALTLNSGYLYGMTESGNLFIFETQKFTTVASYKSEITSLVTDIAVSNKQIFCLAESGAVSVFDVSGDFVVTYDINVSEPENREVYSEKSEQRFPYVNYEKNLFSTHSRICALDNYVVTAGAGDIKVYDRDLNEIKTIDASSVTGLYKNGNSIIYADSGSVYVNNLDSEEESIEICGADSGVIYADETSIYAVNKAETTINIYSYDGTLSNTITGCPSGITKLYAKDGLLYTVADANTDFYIYNLSASADDAFITSYNFGSSYPTISAIEETDGYLYVSTSGTSVYSVNGLFYWDISGIKSGEATSLGARKVYESVSVGGQVNDFVIRGDYIIADCRDAKAIHVVNIQNVDIANDLRPYRESMLKKGNEDNYNFSDIDEANGKIYAISSSGGICVYSYIAVDIADITFVSDGVETYAPQGEKVKAKVSIYNESGKLLEGKLILAVYEGTDAKTLKNSDTIDVSAPNGEGTDVYTEELSIDWTKDITIKAMLFESMESLVPMCESIKNFEGVGETTIYVNASASADGDGSQNAPFRTIAEAKEKVRTINKAMTGDITVEIAGGRYELSEPLKFDENDSGFNGNKVIYKAKAGETPIIAGGRKIDGWQIYDSEKGIYKANANGIRTRQLVVDGERAVRARSVGSLTSATCDDGDLGIYCYNEELLNYKNIKDLELVFNNAFTSKRAMVDSVHKVDSNGKVLVVVNNPFWNNPTAFDKYVAPSYYENALELLDEENEFYLDMEADSIYYKPKAGVNINTSEIYAPVLEELFVFEGKSLYNRVKNVELSGLTFTETTWMMPTDNGGFNTTQAGYGSAPISSSANPVKNAVSFERAEGITVSNCVLKNLGGIAISIISSSSDIKIDNSTVENVSAGGIHIGEIDDSDADPIDTRKSVQDITVSNNLINNVGCEYYTFCGITVATSQNVEISHNEISHTPYSGIHIGWGWDALPKRNITGLKVEYNYIHDVIEVLSDAGAIYHTGMTLADCDLNPNYIRYNYIEKIRQGGSYAGAAIYLDTGSSGYEVSENVVDLSACTGSWLPKWSTGREGNVFKNNYTTAERGYDGATGTVVSVDADWDETAKAIINNAGRNK